MHKKTMQKKAHFLRKKIQTKGFTLLEVMIALSIFSVLLMGVSGIFGGFIKNYKNIKDVQKNLENAQYAMNTMAKELRTSALVSPTNNPATTSVITVREMSSNSCVKFSFDGSNLFRETGNVAPTANADCSTMSYGTKEKMIYQTTDGMKVNGRFLFPIATNPAGVNRWVGVITLVMDVGDQANTKDLVRIQSTVSLRDFDSLN